MLTIEAGDINIFLECGLFSSENVMLFLIRRKGSNHGPLKCSTVQNMKVKIIQLFSIFPWFPACHYVHGGL